MVLCASSGTAALEAVLAAIEAGKTIALANKEVLVMAGGIVMDAARRKGVAVLPGRQRAQRHSSVPARPRAGELRRLILTASGGPFRGRSRAALAEVTAADALKHPTWQMGPKITIDSATLMNKGLEVIEAHWLFGVPASQIEVVVHPQSIVHSMVELKDGSIIAQMGITDMRLPIQYAFSYPDRWDAPVPFLDLTRMPALEFHEPAWDDFPCLRPGLSRARGRAQPADRAERGQRGGRGVVSRGRLGFTAFRSVIAAGHGRARAGRPRRWPTSGGSMPGPGCTRPSRRGVRINKGRHRVTTLLAFLLRARRARVRPRAGPLPAGALERRARADLLARLRAQAAEGAARRHRVLHQRHPARRLREDGRREPRRSATGAADEFLSKTKWQRFQILIAGPAMNLVLAVVLLAVVLMQGADDAGLPRPAGVVGAVQAGSPAERPAFRPGDIITRAWTAEIADVGTARDGGGGAAEREVDVVVIRNGAKSAQDAPDRPIRTRNDARSRSARSACCRTSIPASLASCRASRPKQRASSRATILAIDGERMVFASQVSERSQKHADKPIRDGRAARRRRADDLVTP